MTLRIFVSRDAGAVAVGADEVALAFEQAAAKRGASIEIVRTGSRGLYWLEPMVEVGTAQGRIAFGPVTDTDVTSVLDAMIVDGAHALRLGVTDDVAFDLLHTFCNESVGEFGENFFGRSVEFFLQIVRKFSVRKIGVAAAYQHQIAGETAVGIKSAVSFHRGAETVVRTDQG